MEKTFTCSNCRQENILIWGKPGIGKSYIAEIIKKLPKNRTK